jgi:hypothetical protein
MSDNMQKTLSPRHSPSSREDTEKPLNPAEIGAITHRTDSAGFGGVASCCSCPHASGYRLRSVFRLRAECELLRSEAAGWRWISAALGLLLVGAFLALAFFCKAA